MALDYTAASIKAQAGGVASRPLFMDKFEVPGDAAYATGGYQLDTFLESLVEQSRDIKDVQGHGTNGSTKVDVRWVPSTNKLMVVSTTTGAQLAADTDLSGYTFYLTSWSE